MLQPDSAKMSRFLSLKWKARHRVASLVASPRSYFGILYGCVLAVWLAYAARRATYVPPGGFCADVPKVWLTTARQNASVLPVDVEFGGARAARAAPVPARPQTISSLRAAPLRPPSPRPSNWTRDRPGPIRSVRRGRKPRPRPAAGRLRFVSIWTTDATHWAERNVRGVESIFFHHPNASLTIYSNQLPASAVAGIASLGFDVRIVGYNLTQLLEGTPAAPWLRQLARWEAGPYFYTHVTDAMRLALLFRDGGVYLDTDVVVVRPLRVAAQPEAERRAALARGGDGAAAGARARADEARERAERAADLNTTAEEARHRRPPPLAAHSVGAEAHALDNTPILNGAVMVFSRGSPFLWGAMREFAASYRDYEWGWNGPELLTRVRRKCPAHVAVLPEDRFYPFHWEEVELYSTGGHAAQNAAMWRVIERRAYTSHLWNKKSGGLPLHADSVYARLMSTFRVLPSGAAGPSDGSAAGAAEAAREGRVAGPADDGATAEPRAGEPGAGEPAAAGRAAESR